jgi:hypothetical protein
MSGIKCLTYENIASRYGTLRRSATPFIENERRRGLIVVRSQSMAVKKTRRSRFWVVSTHVLTTGFALPVIAGMVASGLTGALDTLFPLQVFVAQLLFMAIGYLGGAYYSLSYIRKVALIENPRACIKPSIITFILLAVLGFGVTLAARPHDFGWSLSPTVAILGLLVYYVVICAVFAKITTRGFDNMPSDAPEASGDIAK